MHVIRGKGRAVLALLAAVALSACGSTLEPAGTQTVAGGNGLDGGTVVDTGGSQPTDGLAANGGAAGSVAQGTTGPGGARTGATTAGRTGAPSAVAGKTGPIRVGVVTVDVTALFAAFGAQDRVTDPYAADKALAASINKAGGIAGRPVEVEFVTIDVQADYNAEGQRACETFTQDKKVDIVKSNNFSNEVLESCLQQRGVSVVDLNRWSTDRDHLDHPNHLVPDAMRVDRYAPVVIDNAVDLGILKRGNKLGVLYEDCPWGARVYNGVVKPAASKHGVTTEPATVKCVENLVADLGPATTQIRAAVLKFNSAGVTHVLSLTGAEGFATVIFQQAADEQQYHPKYLITTNAFPYDNANQNSPAGIHFSPDDLPNMSGIGFHPLLDTGAKGVPAGNDPQAAVQAECKKADPAAGVTTDDDTRFQQMTNFYNHCDAWFTIRNLLQANGVRFGIADVIKGYRTALASAASTLNVTGRFGVAGNRLDGVGFVRPLAYDPSTKRFAYTGPARSIP